MALSTIFTYSQMLSKSLTADEQAATQVLLDQATSIIETYCDRTFGSNTYAEWVSQEFIDNLHKIVFLRNYPITKVYFVGIPSNVGKITNSNASALQTTLSFDSNSLSQYSVDIYGNEQFGETTAKTLGTLKTEIESNGWSVTLDSNYSNYPVQQMKTFVAGQTSGGYYVDMDIPFPTGIISTINTRPESNYIEMNIGAMDIFVKYVAGYILPVDAAGHGSL